MLPLKFNKLVRITLLMGCMVLLANTALAGPPIPPDPGVPVDGGLSILIAAGVGYGVNKLRKNTQNKSAKDEEVN